MLKYLVCLFGWNKSTRQESAISTPHYTPRSGWLLTWGAKVTTGVVRTLGADIMSIPRVPASKPSSNSTIPEEALEGILQQALLT